LKSTIEETIKEDFGECGHLDAYKYSMANLTTEERYLIKIEQQKLVKKANRPCSSCGVKSEGPLGQRVLEMCHE
jgi:hypothetical protein